MGVYYTIPGKLYLSQASKTPIVPTSLTGVLTSGSPTINNVSSFANIAIGSILSGTGIPPSTTVIGFSTVASTITMSANATATSTTSAPTAITAFGNVVQTYGLTVHLLTGQIPQGPRSTWAQLTEATYDGYIPQNVIYPMVFSTSDDQNVNASCQAMTFAPLDYAISNTITGLAWTYTPPGASAPVLVATEVFPAPITLSAQGDMLRVLPNLPDACDCTALQPSAILP